MSSSDEILRIIAFGESIGFTFEERQITDAFVPGVTIETGMRAVFDRANLVSPGDILHEMGHVAILPEPFRSAAHGNFETILAESIEKWFADNPDFMTLDTNGMPVENPVSRALLQAGETEAQAWSYAAAIACGIDPESVFHARAYDGNSPYLIAGLSVVCHAGINGLSAAGFCRQKSFPILKKWLQDAR